jgi:hypothetical protein
MKAASLRMGIMTVTKGQSFTRFSFNTMTDLPISIEQYKKSLAYQPSMVMSAPNHRQVCGTRKIFVMIKKKNPQILRFSLR